MNKWPFLLKMHKENNGQCREKNEKLCKVKRAGESNRAQVIDRTEYKASFWKSQHFFLKKPTNTYARTPLPLFVFVCFSKIPLSFSTNILFE